MPMTAISTLLLGAIGLALFLLLIAVLAQEEKGRKLLYSSSATIFFLVGGLLVYFGQTSIAPLLDIELMEVICGIALTVAATRPYWARGVSPLAIRCAMFIIGLVSSGFAVQAIYGDFFRIPVTDTGVVRNIVYYRGKDGSESSSEILMDNLRYQVTLDIAHQVTIGEWVTLEIGKGSGAVLRVTPVHNDFSTAVNEKGR